MPGRQFKSSTNLKSLLIVICLLLPLNLSLHSQEIHISDTTKINASDERKKTFLYVRATPFLIPGVAIGLTRRLYLSKNGFIDLILSFHYHYYDNLNKSVGVSITSEHFANKEAKGFFYRFNLGVEYGEYQNPFDFSDDPEDINGLIPNITYGVGYGFNIRHFLQPRICIESGMTWLIGRINLEWVF